MSLARASNVPSIRESIASAVKAGFKNVPGRPQTFQPETLAKLQDAGGILTAATKCTFEDLLLPIDLQCVLDEFVLELEYRTELAERGLRARNRFLFWGPPGNGKTSCASALASALSERAFVVSIPELGSQFLHGTEQNLGKLFSTIRDGMVIVFDEIDAIGSARGQSDSSAGKSQNAVVNTLLTLLDRHTSGVIVATTNRPDMIDTALQRRFDEQVEFPAPTREQMRSLARKLCEKYTIAEVDVSDCANFDEVSKRVATEARRRVMRELLAADDTTDESEGNAA